MSFLRTFIIALGCCTIGFSAPVPKQPTTPYVKWTKTPENARNGMNSLVVAKELVIVATDKGDLQAYRSDNGKLTWTYNHGKRIYHAISADEERVYFTSASGLSAVTIADGKLDWAYEVANGDGPVLALKAKGLVLYADNDGTLYSFLAKSGKQLWTADFIADAPADPPGFVGNNARIAPAKARPYNLVSDGDTVFLNVFDQCRLIAFNIADGKQKYSFQTQGWVGGSAAVNSSHVFIGSQDSFVYCLDKKSGKEVWKFQAKGRADDSIAVEDKSVFFSSSAGFLYCVSENEGKVRWRFEADRKPSGRKNMITGQALVRDGLLYAAASDGHFYAISAETGKCVWKLQPDPDSQLSGSFACDGNRFFVLTSPQLIWNGEPAPNPPGTSSLIAISLK